METLGCIRSLETAGPTDGHCVLLRSDMRISFVLGGQRVAWPGKRSWFKVNTFCDLIMLWHPGS